MPLILKVLKKNKTILTNEISPLYGTKQTTNKEAMHEKVNKHDKYFDKINVCFDI